GLPGCDSPGPRGLWRRRDRHADRRHRPARSQRLAELRALPRRGCDRDRGLFDRTLSRGRRMPAREPGPRSRRSVEQEPRPLAPGLQSFAQYAGVAMARGAGSMLYDEDGNEYIDFIAGIGVGSVGHCHPYYVETLKRQVERLTFGSFTTETR